MCQCAARARTHATLSEPCKRSQQAGCWADAQKSDGDDNTLNSSYLACHASKLFDWFMHHHQTGNGMSCTLKHRTKVPGAMPLPHQSQLWWHMLLLRVTPPLPAPLRSPVKLVNFVDCCVLSMSLPHCILLRPSLLPTYFTFWLWKLESIWPKFT